MINKVKREWNGDFSYQEHHSLWPLASAVMLGNVSVVIRLSLLQAPQRFRRVVSCEV